MTLLYKYRLFALPVVFAILYASIAYAHPDYAWWKHGVATFNVVILCFILSEVIDCAVHKSEGMER